MKLKSSAPSSYRPQTTLMAPIGITPVPYYTTRAPIMMSITTLQKPSAINPISNTRQPQVTTTMNVSNIAANKSKPSTPAPTSTLPSSLNPTPVDGKKKQALAPKKAAVIIRPAGASTTSQMKQNAANPPPNAKTASVSPLNPAAKKGTLPISKKNPLNPAAKKGKLPISKNLLIGAGVAAVVVAVLVLKR